jgi:hypothetical protein
MADWGTAAIAAGSALAASAITGVVTYRVTDRQVRSAESQQDLTRRHERSQRIRDQRLDPYAGLINCVASFGDRARWRLEGGKHAAPKVGDLSIARRGRLALVVSPEVLESLDSLGDALEKLEEAERLDVDVQQCASLLADLAQGVTERLQIEVGAIEPPEAVPVDRRWWRRLLRKGGHDDRG